MRCRRSASLVLYDAKQHHPSRVSEEVLTLIMLTGNITGRYWMGWIWMKLISNLFVNSVFVFVRHACETMFVFECFKHIYAGPGTDRWPVWAVSLPFKLSLRFICQSGRLLFLCTPLSLSLPLFVYTYFQHYWINQLIGGVPSILSVESVLAMTSIHQSSHCCQTCKYVPCCSISVCLSMQFQRVQFHPASSSMHQSQPQRTIHLLALSNQTPLQVHVSSILLRFTITSV